MQFLAFNFYENVRNMFLGLATFVYSLLAQMAQLFFDISTVQILDNPTVSAIYQRIGLILGLFMLFKLTFSFIQMVVDPDQITDKEKGIGGIIKKVMVVVLLLGMTPTIFKWGFELQEAIIKDNTIGNVILGTKASNTGEMGKSFAINLFASFADDEIRAEFENGMLSGELSYGDIKDYIDDTTITGIGIGFFCLAVGVVALWMFLTYTIATAARIVQLMFLELIAPIPIISYISSKKENGFTNWVKQCITTYIDLFIRMAILYLSILMIQLIMANGKDTMINQTAGTGSSGHLLYLMLILGVILFMKKAPQLIEELFPGLKSKASLGFGIGTKDGAGKLAVSAFRRPAGAAIGAVGMGIGGAASRMITKGLDNKQRKVEGSKGLLKAGLTGLGMGTLRGLQGGAMAKKGVMGGLSKSTIGKVSAGNKAFANNQANNYTTKERLEDALAKKFGFQNYTQKLKNDKIGYEGAKSGAKIIEDYHSAGKKEANDKYETGEFMKPDFDSVDGLRVREAGIKRRKLENIAASYTNENSAVYKEYQAKLSSAQNEAEKERIKTEFTTDQMKASYEADEAKKTFEKEYITFVTGDNAGGATNHNLKSKLKLAQQQIETHNKAYDGVPDAQIEYKLTNDFTDLDNFIKGKGEYADGGSKRSARQIKQNADAKLQELDFAIKEREMKQNGNNQGGSGK